MSNVYQEPDGNDNTPESASHPRLQLISEVLVFQRKLALDGLRDLLLVPVSLIAAIIGLMRTGEDPGAPFRDVIRFGIRTEAWINLFGQHDGNTADKLIEPVQQQMIERISRSPALREAAERIGRDRLNSGQATRTPESANPGSNGNQD